MKKITKVSLKALVLSVIMVMLLSGTALANGSAEGIEVSPNVINLDSNGGSFSIHTNISNSSLEVVSLLAVLPNNNSTNITDYWTFSDDMGDLVVKCRIGDVKELISELISEGTITFALTVFSTYSNETTTYYDDVRVISCGE